MLGTTKMQRVYKLLHISLRIQISIFDSHGFMSNLECKVFDATSIMDVAISLEHQQQHPAHFAKEKKVLLERKFYGSATGGQS